MSDAPTKPSLTLLSGKLIRDLDALDEFFFRLTGRRMDEEGRAYAREKLGATSSSDPKTDEPEA